MSLAVTLKGSFENTSKNSSVLIATVDADIYSGLSELFQTFSLNTIWSKSVEAAKRVLVRERVAACFCGFWLQDGTYRELVSHIRRQRVDIPMIIVSPPSCPHEYRDYLSAINICALDFLYHPFCKSDLARWLASGMGGNTQDLDAHLSRIGPGLQTSEAA